MAWGWGGGGEYRDQVTKVSLISDLSHWKVVVTYWDEKKKKENKSRFEGKPVVWLWTW